MQETKYKTFEMQFPFAKYENCFFVISSYLYGGTALMIYGNCEDEDPDSPEPILDATVCVPSSEPLPPSLAYIKDYGENSGVQKILEKLGFIKPLSEFVQSGYVTIELCELDLDRIREYGIERS